MKAPRLTDFDPNRKAPELASPLEGMPTIEPGRNLTDPVEPPLAHPGSPSSRPAAPFFNEKVLPTPLPESAIQQPVEEPPDGRTEERPSVPSAGPPSVRAGKRTITRYAFEFYQDQIDSLRAYSLDEKRRGEKGSMSAMVREAIDGYLARRNRVDE